MEREKKVWKVLEKVFWTRECTLVRWISKQRSNVLGKTFNLHSNFTNAQDVWSFNQLYVLERMRVSNTHIQKCFHALVIDTKFCMFLSYNWLSNWASLLDLFNWALVCGLEWDQKGTNKTLVPMGLGLFCQLLTSPKLPLIIFNPTI